MLKKKKSFVDEEGDRVVIKEDEDLMVAANQCGETLRLLFEESDHTVEEEIPVRKQTANFASSVVRSVKRRDSWLDHLDDYVDGVVDKFINNDFAV
jgi:hypothetical protein